MKGKSKTFGKYIDLQSQAIYVDNFVFKKSLHILEDGASNVQVGIYNMDLSKICLGYDEVHVFLQSFVMLPSRL